MASFSLNLGAEGELPSFFCVGSKWSALFYCALEMGTESLRRSKRLSRSSCFYKYEFSWISSFLNISRRDIIEGSFYEGAKILPAWCTDDFPSYMFILLISFSAGFKSFCFSWPLIAGFDKSCKFSSFVYSFWPVFVSTMFASVVKLLSKRWSLALL